MENFLKLYIEKILMCHLTRFLFWGPRWVDGGALPSAGHVPPSPGARPAPTPARVLRAACPPALGAASPPCWSLSLTCLRSHACWSSYLTSVCMDEWMNFAGPLVNTGFFSFSIYFLFCLHVLNFRSWIPSSISGREFFLGPLFAAGLGGRCVQPGGGSLPWFPDL